jgi:hypothetical protein
MHVVLLFMVSLMLGTMFVYLLDTSKGIDEFCVNMAVIHVGRIRAWSNDPIFYSLHNNCYVFDLWDHFKLSHIRGPTHKLFLHVLYDVTCGFVLFL